MERIEWFNPFLSIVMIVVIFNLGAPLDYHAIMGAGFFALFIFLVVPAENILVHVLEQKQQKCQGLFKNIWGWHYCHILECHLCLQELQFLPYHKVHLIVLK